MLRTIILIATFLTGAAGLIYEVTWHRYLSNLIGSEARAAAIILAVFLGGLAVGYHLFGVISRKVESKKLLSLYGLVEAGIGIWAILFPSLYKIIWEIFGVGGGGSLLGDVALAIGLIGAPTIAMGGTLPLLTQGLSRGLADSAKFHARVYAVNTGGACLGAVAAGFYLLPVLGLSFTMFGASLINLICGGLIYYLGRTVRVDSIVDRSDIDETDTSTVSRPSISQAAIVAFLAGFYSITVQTIFMRLVGVSVGASEYAFSMVVGAFVMMLALGAATVGREIATPYALVRNQIVLLIALSLLFLTVPTWPYWVHVIRTTFSTSDLAFYIYFSALFFVFSLLIAIPVGSMGRTLPLLFGIANTSTKAMGRIVGIIYGANTVGCVFGALLGGYLALYKLNLGPLFLVCLFLVFLSLLLFYSEIKANLQKITIVLPLSIFALAAAIIYPWDLTLFSLGTLRLRQVTPLTFSGPELFYQSARRNHFLIAHKDDPNTSVSVVENGIRPGPNVPEGVSISRSIYVNGKSDGATSGLDLLTTRLLGHLPSLLRMNGEGSAAVIGFGTGITVGALAMHQDIKSVRVIEISPFVREFAPLFDFANSNVSTNPKVSWHMGDAYRALGTTQDEYDIVVSEPSNPWVAGVERLFTQEFYQIVKSRLRKGGIYAQWFHTYDMSERTVGMVGRTFSSVFPAVRIFELGADIVLLGSMEPIDRSAVERLNARLADPKIQQHFGEVAVKSVPHLLAMEAPIPKGAFDKFEIQTLEFPKLSFSAGRDHFKGSAAPLSKLLRRPELRAEMDIAERESLLAQWLGPNPATKELSELYKALCSDDLNDPWFTWRDGTILCRRLTIHLADKGVLPWVSILEPELSMSRELNRGTKSGKFSEDGLKKFRDEYTSWINK